MMRWWWCDNDEILMRWWCRNWCQVGSGHQAEGISGWVIRGYLAASFDINQSHSDDTQTARGNHFFEGIVLESKYRRKIFSLYQNIFWYPSSTRRCLNHLVAVLGQIWNDLQLLIGVFREEGGRSLPLNNNSSLILEHNCGLSDHSLDDLGNSQCDFDRWNSCLVQYLGNRIQGSEDDDKRHSRTFYRS